MEFSGCYGSSWKNWTLLMRLLYWPIVTGIDEDGKARIRKARVAFNILQKIWKSRNITTSVSWRVSFNILQKVWKPRNITTSVRCRVSFNIVQKTWRSRDITMSDNCKYSLPWLMLNLFCFAELKLGGSQRSC